MNILLLINFRSTAGSVLVCSFKQWAGSSKWAQAKPRTSKHSFILSFVLSALCAAEGHPEPPAGGVSINHPHTIGQARIIPRNRSDSSSAFTWLSGERRGSKSLSIHWSVLRHVVRKARLVSLPGVGRNLIWCLILNLTEGHWWAFLFMRRDIVRYAPRGA